MWSRMPHWKLKEREKKHTSFFMQKAQSRKPYCVLSLLRFTCFPQQTVHMLTTFLFSNITSSKNHRIYRISEQEFPVPLLVPWPFTLHVSIKQHIVWLKNHFAGERKTAGTLFSLIRNICFDISAHIYYKIIDILASIHTIWTPFLNIPKRQKKNKKKTKNVGADNHRFLFIWKIIYNTNLRPSMHWKYKQLTKQCLLAPIERGVPLVLLWGETGTAGENPAVRPGDNEPCAYAGDRTWQHLQCLHFVVIQNY